MAKRYRNFLISTETHTKRFRSYKRMIDFICKYFQDWNLPTVMEKKRDMWYVGAYYRSTRGLSIKF